MDREPAQAPPSPVGRAERLLAIGLAGGRIAIGAGLWLAPSRSARALGFDRLDPPALVLARLAATRDLILGGWQLAALADRRSLRRATGAVAAVDAADALAFGLALGDRRTRAAGLRGAPVAAFASLTGAWLSARLADS